MHDLPRQKLLEMLLEYGRSLCEDPRRCEALLKDHCGEYKREIFVLVNALKNGIANDLLKAQSNGVPEKIIWSRAQRRLEDELAMNAKAAQWAVESWALVLGEIAKTPPIAKPTPRDQPTPSTQPSGTVKALLSDRYQDNRDGTVTDVKTGLQWMRFCLGQKWHGEIRVGKSTSYYTWDEAHQTAETLNLQSGYAGYRDWRLPTKDELLTLVYCSSGQPKTWNYTGECCKGKYKQPTIDQAAFPNTPSSVVWSGSSYANDSNNAWNVDFRDGDAYSSYRGNHGHVRLVRGGQ